MKNLNFVKSSDWKEFLEKLNNSKDLKEILNMSNLILNMEKIFYREYESLKNKTFLLNRKEYRKLFFQENKNFICSKYDLKNLYFLRFKLENLETFESDLLQNLEYLYLEQAKFESDEVFNLIQLNIEQKRNSFVKGLIIKFWKNLNKELYLELLNSKFFLNHDILKNILLKEFFVIGKDFNLEIEEFENLFLNHVNSENLIGFIKYLCNNTNLNNNIELFINIYSLLNDFLWSSIKNSNYQIFDSLDKINISNLKIRSGEDTIAEKLKLKNEYISLFNQFVNKISQTENNKIALKKWKGVLKSKNLNDLENEVEHWFRFMEQDLIKVKSNLLKVKDLMQYTDYFTLN